MRILYSFLSFLALWLALSCNVPEFMAASIKHSDEADGKGVSPAVKEAIKEENVTKNEPPTIILNPKDLEHIGIDLNSALATHQEQWTANPILPVKKAVAAAAAYTTIELETATVGPTTLATQVRRQRGSNEVKQSGQPASTHTMKFKSQAAGILDVLLVIDSSGSMSDEQQAMKDNLPDLLTHVGKSNWQISVVNTDPKCDFRPPISKTTTDFENKYKSMVAVGTYGGTELAVYNAIRSMKGECSNSPWQRQGSTIAVIIITDEPHQCRDASVCSTASKLQTYLHSIRAPSDVKIFGLISGSGWNRESMFAHKGDIKDKSQYKTIFQAISGSVKSSLKSSYSLAHTPDSISYVKVDGKSLRASDYTLNGKILTFNAGILPKDRDVDVEVHYSHGFKPYVYDAALDFLPLNQADKIAVIVKKPGVADKTLQYDTDFSVSGKQLTFLKGCSASGCTVLPAGATAQIQYQENIALKSRFAVTGSATHNIMMNTFAVMVNSVAKSRPADFKIATERNGDKAIEFSSPPAEGAKIEISYVHMTKLDYAFTLNTQNTSNTINCKDFRDQSKAISCLYANGHLKFSTDVVTNKVIVVEQLVADTPSLDNPLDGDYVGSSIEVRCVLGNGGARDLAYSISASVLSLDEEDYNACKQSALDGSTSYHVSIDYKVRHDEQDNFFIGYGSFFSKYAGQYKFVYVLVEIDSDGDGWFSTVNPKDYNFEFDYYSAEDARIAFLKTLPDNTKVKATVYLLPH